MINLHLIFSFAEYEITSASLSILRQSFSITSDASLNCGALSYIISHGAPWLATNLQSPTKNCSVDMTCISTK